MAARAAARDTTWREGNGLIKSPAPQIRALLMEVNRAHEALPTLRRYLNLHAGPRPPRMLTLFWTASVPLAQNMSEPEARGPEDHDAPLEWRAPSHEAVPA